MNHRPARIACLRVFLLGAIIVAGHCRPTLAVDFLWTGKGEDDSWFNFENWVSPNGGIPNGEFDVAFFNEGPGTTVSLLGTNIQLKGISFGNASGGVDSFEIANGGINFLDAVDLRVISGDHRISADLAGGGNLGLIKRGPGNLELAGAADFSSDVTIEEGALIVSTTVSADEVFVRPGGGLFGTGKIQGDTFVGGAGGSPQRPALLGAGNLGDDPLGRLSFFGDLTLGANAKTVLEIGKEGEDLLEISGAVAFGGLLDVDLVDDFIPGLGATFPLINAGSHVIGTYFDQIDEVILPNGEAITIFLTSGGGDVVLFAMQTFRGDMNLDLTVDELDGPLFALAIQDEDAYDDRFWSSDCTAGDCVADYEMADIGDDGNHTFDDLIEFVDVVNSLSGEATLTPTAVLAMLATPSAIPEPSSFSLLMGLCFLGHLARGRR